MSTFTSIHHIPPEVLSHYCGADEYLITLTRMSRVEGDFHFPSLVLNRLRPCGHRKTRIYLKLPKTYPLDIRPERGAFPAGAFTPTAPHPSLLGSLSLSGSLNNLFELTIHLGSPAPFLKKLALIVTYTVTYIERHIPQDDIFDGDLSSLHEL